MSRTKKKKPGGGKASCARNTLRERDRDLPTPQKLCPPDSTRAPSTHKAVRQRPRCSPASQLCHEARKENKFKQRLDKQSQTRNALMKTRSADILDLRHVDGYEPGEHHDHFESQDASESFRVLFSTGFLGYSGHTKNSAKQVKVVTFKHLLGLAGIFLRLLRSQLTSSLGMQRGTYEIAGYELCFPEGFICGEVVIPANQAVLIRSRYMLRVWADQVYEGWRYEYPEIVVRIAKPGGDLFDPTFRTDRDMEAARKLQKSPNQPTPEEAIAIAAVEMEKTRRRRGNRQQGQDRKTETDTSVVDLQKLMEMQNLSDDDDYVGADTKVDTAMYATESRITRSHSRILSHYTQQHEMDLD